MSSKTADDIHNYIKFIEKCGYTISISFIGNSFSIYTEEFMKYDFHPHSVCNYLKRNPKTCGNCIDNKKD